MTRSENGTNALSIETVQVELSERSYSIYIGAGVLLRFSEMLRDQFPKTKHAIIVYDANVQAIAAPLSDRLADERWRTTCAKVPSGEASKSIDQINQLWTTMLEDHTDRGSIVVAIGGGVVGDLAGFAAATFARGIPIVQVPTTLLSQVDSSVGGKTGINLPGAKNIVGAFWQPSLVLIDTSTLDTLPERDFVSGLAEVAKYGVIQLPGLFDYLEANHQAILKKTPEAIAHIVTQSCQAKADVVQEDEHETSGRRATLNYGHTFAHALETVKGYGTLLHGEAVAIGMHMAALLALSLGRVDLGFVARQEALLKSLGLPTRYSEANTEELWNAMGRDKKVVHGQLRFVLPTRLGHVGLVPNVEKQLVCEAIEKAHS